MGMPSPNLEFAVFPSAARTTTTNSTDIADFNANAGIFHLNITAASGTTPTLDIKIQAKCEATGVYTDIPGASFSQKTGTGTDMLVVCPGVTVSANKAVSHPLPIYWRAVATIGGTTPSFTFSLHSQEVTV